MAREKITLDTMTDDEFDLFYSRLPERVRMLAKGRTVSWQSVIDEWFNKIMSPQLTAAYDSKPIDPNEIPF